jgi:hypothetical protein
MYYCFSKIDLEQETSDFLSVHTDCKEVRTVFVEALTEFMNNQFEKACYLLEGLSLSMKETLAEKIPICLGRINRWIANCYWLI